MPYTNTAVCILQEIPDLWANERFPQILHFEPAKCHYTGNANLSRRPEGTDPFRVSEVCVYDVELPRLLAGQQPNQSVS